MDKRWVLNASPVILLAKAEVIQFVPRLCSELVVTAGTTQEVLHSNMGDEGNAWLRGEGAIHVRRAPEIPSTIAALGLGLGESEVIAWLLANPGFEGVLDDLQARRCARSLQLPIIGSLRVLIVLKEHGFISSIKPAVSRIMDAGSYLSEALIREALQLAHEG